MTFGLSGPPFVHATGAAEDLAGFIQARIKQNPGGRCIEVNDAGERDSRTFAELHRRALQILPLLQEQATAGECDIVLCFASALDFVPAAWACIYGGYTCHPWHLMGGLGGDHAIGQKLEAIGQKLDNPVLVTTDSIKSKIIGGGGSPFRGAICIDKKFVARPATGSHSRPTARCTDDAAFLVSTSGTTASAKFAIIANQCLLNQFLALQDDLSTQARIFCFPFEGISGLLIIFPALADRIYLQPGRTRCNTARSIEVGRRIPARRL